MWTNKSKKKKTGFLLFLTGLEHCVSLAWVDCRRRQLPFARQLTQRKCIIRSQGRSKGKNPKANINFCSTYFSSDQRYIPFKFTFFPSGIRPKKRHLTAFPQHYRQGQICSVLSRCIQFLAMLESWSICRPLMHRQAKAHWRERNGYVKLSVNFLLTWGFIYAM